MGYTPSQFNFLDNVNSVQNNFISPETSNNINILNKEASSNPPYVPLGKFLSSKSQRKNEETSLEQNKYKKTTKVINSPQFNKYYETPENVERISIQRRKVPKIEFVRTVSSRQQQKHPHAISQNFLLLQENIIKASRDISLDSNLTHKAQMKAPQQSIAKNPNIQNAFDSEQNETQSVTSFVNKSSSSLTPTINRIQFIPCQENINKKYQVKTRNINNGYCFTMTNMKLKHIPANLVSQLIGKKLTILDLNHNSLTQDSFRILRSLNRPTQVRELYLRSNLFRNKLKASFMKSFLNVQILDLQHNQLQHLEIEQDYNRSINWSDLIHLKDLSIQGNEITSIEYDTLDNVLNHTKIHNFEYEWSVILTSLFLGDRNQRKSLQNPTKSGFTQLGKKSDFEAKHAKYKEYLSNSQLSGVTKKNPLTLRKQTNQHIVRKNGKIRISGNFDFDGEEIEDRDQVEMSLDIAAIKNWLKSNSHKKIKPEMKLEQYLEAVEQNWELNNHLFRENELQGKFREYKGYVMTELQTL